jgi:uncharacterized RDD family membrane protein YckC
MNETKKQCHLCAEDIPINATVCEFCGARYAIKTSGYCANCHTVREVDEVARCRVCHGEVIDLHSKSQFLDSGRERPGTVQSQPVLSSAPASEVLEILPIKGEGVFYRVDSVLVDFFFIALIYTALIIILALVSGTMSNLTRLFNYSNINPDSLGAIFSTTVLLLLPVVWFLYFFIWEGAAGTTPGKVIHYLRVIKKAGGKATWGQAAIRAVFSLLEDNLIGAIVIASTPQKQRIGDLVAGTLVVNKAKISKVEMNPPEIALEFHDHRREEFSRLTEGVMRSFGAIHILKLKGLSKTNTPKTLKVRGHFFKSGFDMLSSNIERRYGIHLAKRIIIWRLLVVIFVSLILIGFVFAFIFGMLGSAGGIKMPIRSSPVVEPEVVMVTNTTQPSATPRPTTTRTFRPTATPMPVEITFDTIGDHEVGTKVILVGRLAMFSSTICDDRCGLLLENPANTAQKVTIFVKVGDLPNQMKALFEGYTKSDIQVRLDDGTYAVIGYRIRVTGRICETTSGNPCISSIEKIELFQVQ